MSYKEQEELDLIYQLSRAHSLAVVPGKNNWIEKTSDNGLPDYISRIAKHIMESGKSRSVAIASAISQVKKWAAGGEDVHPDTRAKAAAALAEWEKLKAANKARKGKKLAMSNIQGKFEMTASPYELLALSVSYNMDSVRSAFNAKLSEARKAKRSTMSSYEPTPYDYMYVKEVWNDFIVVQSDSGKDDLYQVPYSVDPKGNFIFGEPVKVKTQYVTVKDLGDSEGDVTLSAEEVESILAAEERVSLSNSAKFAQALVEKLS